MTPERVLAILAWIARILSWPFVRFDLAGAEKINDEIDGVIIAVNHRSMFDIAAGLIVFQRYGRLPRILVEKHYVDNKWTRPFARAIGAIPVDRKGDRAGALDAAVATLAQGKTVLLLPEGKLHWNPDDPISTGPASTGVARMAAAAGVPVVAAGMVGTEQVWPADRKLLRLNPFTRRKIVAVRIADQPIAFASEDRYEQTDQVMAEVRVMMALAQQASEALTLGAGPR